MSFEILSLWIIAFQIKFCFNTCSVLLIPGPYEIVK